MIAEFGPGIISITGWNYERVDESPTGWRIFFQQGGIYGHAVVAVGYDEYGLIIRNSWGEYWANGGHAHLPWAEVWKGIGDMHFVTDSNLEEDEMYGSEYRCEYPNIRHVIHIQNHEGTPEEVCTARFNNHWNPSGDNANFPGCQDCTCCHKLNTLELQGNEKDNYKACYKDDTLLTMGRAFHHTLGGSECSESCSDTHAKLLICRGDECA
eukprot:UN25523